MFDIVSECFDLVFGGVTTHDKHAGDVASVNINESFDFIFCELLAYVLPEMFTMAVGTVIRAVCEVYCQTHFIRYFLKDDVIVVVFQHPSVLKFGVETFAGFHLTCL